jgi:hypothetical protein
MTGLMCEEEIIIHSGRNSILMLDAIASVDAMQICGVRSFSDEPLWTGLEALAQLGAFHARYITMFDRHVFLLKIDHCSFPAAESLTGDYAFSGELISRSDSAFYYRLAAEKSDQPAFKGEFLFAAVDYDQKFVGDTLRTHYEKTFLCLLKDMKPA